MHSGPLAILRVWLMYAPPWQQLLIGLGFVCGGVAVLVLFGHFAGLLLVLFGVVVARPALAAWRPRRRAPELDNTKTD